MTNKTTQDEAKHTSGSWVIREDESHLEVWKDAAHCSFLVAVARDHHEWGSDEAEFNAVLIAAAPDLLAALELMVSPFEHLEGCLWRADKRMSCQCDPRGRAAAAIDQARAAIAKAKCQSA